MIIDAMDMLYTSELEGFCLVSSDSDFTKLASRLRESGKTVIGMGENKTPAPFRKACDIFTVLELLLEDSTGENDAVARGQIEEAVIRIITENEKQRQGDRSGRGGEPPCQTVPGF